MRQAFLPAIIILAPNQADAQNPPTAYAPYATPYDGTEAWYCERVSATSNGRCNMAGISASISSLPILTSASLLTTTGTITTGGAATAGFNLNLGNISYTGTLPNAQLSFTFPLSVGNGGTGTATPALVAGTQITITGSWPNNTIAKTNPVTYSNSPGNPTGLTNAAQRMLGLKGSITPTGSGTVVFSIQGDEFVMGGEQCSVQFRYGTPAPGPNNNAAATGTLVGPTISLYVNTVWSMDNFLRIVTGLTPGTSYWFDLSMAAVSGTGVCALENMHLVAFEL
jgi:hypothetical protein